MAELRARIAAAGRHGRTASHRGALPFGLPAIDAHLPPGGLLLGAVHELRAAGPDTEAGAAPALLAAGVLARHPGPVLWIGGPDAFGPGLARAGLDPGRVVFVDAGRGALGAAEEALRHPGVAGVVCELDGRLDLVASRRLQLAAEGSAVLGLLIRRSRRHDDPALAQPCAATTRWRVAMLPAAAAPAARGHAGRGPGAVAARAAALSRRRGGVLDRGGHGCAGSSRSGCRAGRPTGCAGATPRRRLMRRWSRAGMTGAGW